MNGGWETGVISQRGGRGRWKMPREGHQCQTPQRWKGRRQGLLLQTGAPHKGRAEGCIEPLVTKCLSRLLIVSDSWEILPFSHASFPPSFLTSLTHFLTSASRKWRGVGSLVYQAARQVKANLWLHLAPQAGARLGETHRDTAASASAGLLLLCSLQDHDVMAFELGPPKHTRLHLIRNATSLHAQGVLPSHGLAAWC